MEKYYIGLDVGGTEIKCALLSLSSEPTIYGEISYFPANAQNNKNEIISHFCNIITQTAKSYNHAVKISGVRMAFPGPFDYENGICLMSGLTKYEAIYGINLKQAFESELRCRNDVTLSSEFDILFVNDVGGFALGELNFGMAKASKRALFVCIGTGCGSAFSIENQLANEHTPNVPHGGYIYNLPFRESRIDDYISKRGLCNISQEILHSPLQGHELAELASHGDQNALLCFKLFGESLNDALMPIITSYKPDCLVLGGQVMKSAPFFTTQLETNLKQSSTTLYLTTDTSRSTLKGLLKI